MTNPDHPEPAKPDTKSAAVAVLKWLDDTETAQHRFVVRYPCDGCWRQRVLVRVPAALAFLARLDMPYRVLLPCPTPAADTDYRANARPSP